jgi:hypothetical protein
MQVCFVNTSIILLQKRQPLKEQHFVLGHIMRLLSTLLRRPVPA